MIVGRNVARGVIRLVGRSVNPIGEVIPVPVNTSIWYPGLNLSAIPWTTVGTFVETARPVTSREVTVTTAGELAAEVGTPGTHITVQAGTSCGEIFFTASDVRITFGVGCTVARVYFGNVERIWCEGNRTQFIEADLNFINTFEANAYDVGFTDCEFICTNGTNNIIGMTRWTYVRCTWYAAGFQKVNLIGNSQDILLAACNFISSGGWTWRNSGNLPQARCIMVDCFARPDGETDYTRVRITGGGWWILRCHLDASTGLAGALELALEEGQEASDVWVDESHLYNSNGFGAHGTVNLIRVRNSTFYNSTLTSDADIVNSIEADAISATDVEAFGNTFTTGEIPAYPDPPGTPAEP